MKTYLECIPCFLNQALKAMNLTNEDDKTKERVMKEIMKRFANIDLNRKPPEFARLVYNIIEGITGNDDPYKEIKERDNHHALSLLPEIKKTIAKSNDPLLTTIKTSIAGNIMDFAIKADYNLKKAVEEVIKSDFAINDFGKFKEDIKKTKSIVYLADNAGEIVFDKLLIEKIRELNKSKIYFFIKGKPILNDATEIDAKLIGVNQMVNIEIRKINTGFPNTGIKKESEEFTNFIKQMDLVISKGQGNYESLSDVDANIYFLLIAKCPIIARDLGVEKENIILKSNKHGGS
jgi:uncharacterized protein with ATP-grasp and redox domains